MIAGRNKCWCIRVHASAIARHSLTGLYLYHICVSPIGHEMKIELQIKVADVIFYVSLLSRLAYIVIRIKQSQQGCHSCFQAKLIF